MIADWSTYPVDLFCQGSGMTVDTNDMHEIKTQLAILTAAVERMETHMTGLKNLDRDISVINLKQEQTDEALIHIRERHDQLSASCVRADEILHKRVDELVRETSTFHSRASGGFYVVCAMGTIVIAICTWALAQITKNTEINIEQNQRVLSLERNVAEMERRQFKGEKP